MIINLDHGEKCQAKLTAEIPAGTVSSEGRNVTDDFLRYAKVPGYRPGKVPRALIEKRFADGIRRELEKRLVQQALDEVSEAEGVNVLKVLSRRATPNVDGTYTVHADLLVAPSFELPEYNGIPITLPKAEVLEEHVEKLIEGWKEENAGYDPVEDGQLEMGQFAVVDFTATKDGQPLATEDSGPISEAFFWRQEAWMRMEEGSFLPGFCGKLLGHKPGDEFEFTLELPENFVKEELAGQEVSYAVYLKQIMAKTLPEFTDENVRETTSGDFETAEDFKLDLADRLALNMEKFVDRLHTGRVLDYLMGLVDFELPDALIKEESQHYVNRIVGDSQEQGYGEEYLVGKEREIVDRAVAMGRRDVKKKFILNQIARAEELEISRAEVSRRVDLMAAGAGVSAKKMVRLLRDNNTFDLVVEDVLFGKALDFVKEKASVSVDEAQNAVDLMWDSDGTG